MVPTTTHARATSVHIDSLVQDCINYIADALIYRYIPRAFKMFIQSGYTSR